jgi:putative acetyltransferase
MTMQIRRDDLSDPRVHALLREHLDDMRRWSPPESIHALDLDALRAADLRFWTLWDGEELLGCGALRELDAAHGEIKSMRTARAHRRRGVARAMLDHLLAQAQALGYTRLSLETGSMAAFGPARALYVGAGFQPCPPFADYRPDPNSVFLTRGLPAAAGSPEHKPPV